MLDSNLNSNSKTIDWSELSVSKREARGIDDYDLGEVKEIGPDYVVTQRGSIIGKRFYIPKYLVEGFDGKVVWFKVSGAEAENYFTRESPPSVEEYSKYKTPEVPTDIETRIPVLAERLEVSKTESIAEAAVIKEPILETKTVEMPVTHEELVIERRPVTDVDTTDNKKVVADDVTDEVAESRTEINIPLRSEKIQVTKEPFVKEELVVKKKQVTEMRTVTEEVRSENVTVNGPDGKDLEEKG
jgi:uncharacterized protein (TIGR02271 family)